MPDGDGPYHICGTVTSIPDGAQILVTVANYWSNPGPPPEYGATTSTFTATVDGGAFVSDQVFYFYGEGSFSVNAMYQGINDTEYGQVSAP